MTTEVTRKPRTPRKAPVKAAVETAAPARKPRAKKAAVLAKTEAPAPRKLERVPFPALAKRLGDGLQRFADMTRSSSLSVAAFGALVASLNRENSSRYRGTAPHRNSGSRAHRKWARRRAAGRA